MKLLVFAVAGSAGVVGVLRAHVDLLETVEVDGLDESGVMDLVRSNERAVRVLHGVAVPAAVRLDELGGLSAEDVFSTVGKHVSVCGSPSAAQGQTGRHDAEVHCRSDRWHGWGRTRRHCCQCPPQTTAQPAWQATFDARDGVYAFEGHPAVAPPVRRVDGTGGRQDL